MAQVTLNEIITAVRELTFDRFIIPAFAIKAKGGDFSLTIDNKWDPSVEFPGETSLGRLCITQTVGEIVDNIVTLPFFSHPTMESILNALIESEIVIAYTPYFKGTEPSTSLLKVTNKKLDTDYTSFRRYFFSDVEIEEKIKWYYLKVLDIPNVLLTEDVIAQLQRPSEQHMAIWVAYQLVDKRRLYENAALNIGQSFTDGSDYAGSMGGSSPSATTVQIGSVFSVTENASEGFFQEDFSRVGSENIFGDRYSFWFKLSLYLRQLLEETFGDYSLRKTNVLVGNTELVRDLDFRSYYDSYPFTLSPLSRGIISKTP